MDRGGEWGHESDRERKIEGKGEGKRQGEKGVKVRATWKATVYAIAATNKKHTHNTVNAGSSLAHWFFVCL